MAFVVMENCINCKHTTCAGVCPVDCFYEGPNFLAIAPQDCIDCGICAAVCPVNAIMERRHVPADQQEFIRLNAELCIQWPKISQKKSPPPDSEEWEGVPDKLKLLER
ncbi:MAG TPA: ferredoxin FdxA [Pseudomonadales bacterium]|jgi:ferredoxin|nr:ferredoxin [Gammaproteobacteria bacterium]MDP6027858.1 ferredoxin family protein [Pseudomonadales bacterium]MDP6316183.1 ferredoxin family protein [Pseudomonadales bacterium]MDP7315653.1 ferredoxin family protein [Pseudomonadales bacterium]MDP7576737.1 ferredoxin family protein [Pseudomonadales bacterium]|tara:strand:- start:24343 stop:24666 length:324 start_codon:yes stop_codon:yes gene_type:complete